MVILAGIFGFFVTIALRILYTILSLTYKATEALAVAIFKAILGGK